MTSFLCSVWKDAIAEKNAILWYFTALNDPAIASPGTISCVDCNVLMLSFLILAGFVFAMTFVEEDGDGNYTW